MIIPNFHQANPKEIIHVPLQFRFSSRIIIRFDLHLVTSWALDCVPLNLLVTNKILKQLTRYAPTPVPVHGVWRLTDPNSFLESWVSDYSPCRLLLPSSQSITWLALAIWSVTALLLKQVSDDFRFYRVYSYLCYFFGIFMMFTQWVKRRDWKMGEAGAGVGPGAVWFLRVSGGLSGMWPVVRGLDVSVSVRLRCTLSVCGDGEACSVVYQIFVPQLLIEIHRWKWHKRQHQTADYWNICVDFIGV